MILTELINLSGYGLPKISLSKLGSVVILAGPNGSGKSRLLRLIKERLDGINESGLLDTTITDIQEKELRLETATRAGREEEARKVEPELERLRSAARTTFGISFEKGGAIDAVLFMPKNTKLSRYLSEREGAIKKMADSAHNTGGMHLAEAAIPYIQKLQRKWLYATHPKTSTEDAREVEDSYNELNEGIFTLLGEKISIIEGEPSIFGTLLSEDNLSHGQKILLQLAVGFHAQKTKLGSLVLLLDEPETHLHPSSLITVLERLRAANPEGQLWIATHSLSVLAWGGHEALWFVSNGKVKWGGKEPEEVLRSLLGDEEQVGKFGDLLRLPGQMASSRFAAECLLEPRVVFTGRQDPQLTQIREQISELIHPEGRIRILDYGAGKGRLIASICDSDYGLEKVDYRAYEPGEDNENLTSLVRAISRAYGQESLEQRMFKNHEALESCLDAQSVDVVVICNTLHEIPVSSWINIIGPNSSLARLLAPDGYILIVEDLHIRVGEKAHKNGFLILGEPELRKLFGVSETTQQILTVKRSGERLAAFRIPSSLILNVSTQSRKDALQTLQRNALAKVRDIRNKHPSYMNGELHGLYSQLHTNATLALEDI